MELPEADLPLPDPIPTELLTPSEKRLGTELDGFQVLLEDSRMQRVSVEIKKKILKGLYVSGAFKPQAFDAVMTPEPMDPLTEENITEHLSTLRLVEMKTTRAAIQDAALNKFFFGATDSEFQVAKALKDRYVFAFVVLNSDNTYGRPFFILLTLEQLQARIRTSRIQYQINFRSDMPNDDALFPRSGEGPLGL